MHAQGTHIVLAGGELAWSSLPQEPASPMRFAECNVLYNQEHLHAGMDPMVFLVKLVNHSLATVNLCIMSAADS